jgi:DNA repair exonuclease SbcCD nuclease subunit
MKVILVSDTHFGARGDNQQFANYFAKFYNEVFFPYIDANAIDTIIHLGDLVDKRPSINFLSLDNLYYSFIKPCIQRNMTQYYIVGNHDSYYKNTIDVNALTSILRYAEFDNETISEKYKIHIINQPQEIKFEADDQPYLFIPWICSDNFDQTVDLIHKTKANIVFGHLELQGFEMFSGSYNEDGYDPSMFMKFESVFSGHYHKRSTRGNITYLGCPYQITWSDYGDPHGFHMFDTETNTLTFIENPLHIFYRFVYDDSIDIDKVKYALFRDKKVKIIVRSKLLTAKYDLFISNIEQAGVLDIKVVEDHQYINRNDDSDIVSNAEDLPTIINHYIDQLEVDDPQRIRAVIFELFEQAQRV